MEAPAAGSLQLWLLLLWQESSTSDTQLLHTLQGPIQAAAGTQRIPKRGKSLLA
jgi:hypothetical protein